MSTCSRRKMSNSSSSKTLDLLFRTSGRSSFTGLEGQRSSRHKTQLIPSYESQSSAFAFLDKNVLQLLEKAIFCKSFKKKEKNVPVLGPTSAWLGPACLGLVPSDPPECCWWPAQSCSRTPAGRPAGTHHPNPAAGLWCTTAENPAPLGSTNTLRPEEAHRQHAVQDRWSLKLGFKIQIHLWKELYSLLNSRCFLSWERPPWPLLLWGFLLQTLVPSDL